MNTPTHTKSVKTLLKRLILPSLILLILFALDFSSDIGQKDSFEVLIEITTYLLLIYIALIGFEFYKLDKKSFETASNDIISAQNSLTNIKKKNKLLQDGINARMQEAFMMWKLTIAESDVAILIVKGFSLSEIAYFRGTSERTIRDQAASIYRKAKLKNRIELSAYFLEDLL